MTIKLDLKIADNKNPTTSFERIAKCLFNNYCIENSNGQYAFTEIEFYYFNESHYDIHCHNDRFQKENGTWYFHWSGIDITIGDNKSTGGILIRGIKNEKDYFDGPLNVMKELLSGKINILEGSLKLKLILKLASTNETIYKSKRIGLNLKKEEEKDEKYFDKPYRFISNIENPAHKYKDKGIVQKHGEKLK